MGVTACMDLKLASWTHVEGRGTDEVVHLRHRHMPGGAAMDKYPHRLNLVWRMLEAAPNGLPTDAESTRLKAFEDRLVSAVEHDTQAVLSLVRTEHGEREFVFQARDSDEFLRRLTGLPERYPIALSDTDDPTWAYVGRVMAELGLDDLPC